MGPVYATRLTILPDERHPASGLHERAVALCHKWLWDLGQQYGIPVGSNPNADEGGRHPTNGSYVRALHLVVANERAWRAVVVHPYRSDSGNVNHVQMRIEIQAREEDGEEVVTIRALLGSTIDRIQPWAFDFKVPGIVRALVGEFSEASGGNVSVRPHPTWLADTDMDRLCHEIARSSRFAPVIVISRTDQEELLCDPQDIAGAILGLGRVYVLPSFRSAYALTDRFGRRLSCHSGAVRIYWPEFSANDDPYRHQLWISLRILNEQLHDRFPAMIFGVLAPASAIGIGSDVQTWSLYESAQQQKTRAMIDRAREMSEQRAEATAQDYYDLVERLDEVNKQYQDLQERSYALESEKLLLQNAVATSGRAALGPHPVDIVAETRSIGSVSDAVAFVAREVDTSCLEFLPDAHESAAEGHFGNGMDIVWQHLLRLHQAARRYHDDPNAKLQEVMREVGATEHQFKTDISDSARGEHGHHYARRYVRNGDTTMIKLGPHLKNGKGNAHKSLYIYWYVDEDCRKFVVGHVGRKLPDSTGGYR